MDRNRRSIFLGVLFAGVLTVHAADNPPVPSVPGQSAINSPTPQPPAQGTKPMSPPMPGDVARDSNGVPTLIVEFNLDHSDIPQAFQHQLNAFGAYLRDHPGSTAALAGYADNSGHGPANGTLAQKRADAVAAYLTTQYGIDSTRLKSHGYGMVTDKPENSTAAARQADRRVFGKITTSNP